MSLLILFSTVAKGSVCIPACAVCQSDRGQLPSACMSMCVCAWKRAREREGERERENVCVCLCVSHCSERASRGCFKQAALPMWPAQPQAGIHYKDTHTHTHAHTHAHTLTLCLLLSLSLSPSPSPTHPHTVSIVHPLATAQGSGGNSPHT